VSPTFALLPSPLLAAVAWDPVRDALRRRGCDAFVAPLPDRVETPADVRDSFVASASAVDDVVLVPHSNAGLYAPHVAEAADAVGTVFVDAAMPTTSGAAPLAPPGFFEFLSTLADGDGLLPPWTRWWGDADLAGLFPSAEWRQRVADREPRLPLAYFASTVDVPAGWSDRPCAYIAFGETYAAEIAAARERGWPVTVVDGEHLYLLHDPEGVADQIAVCAAELALS
jgi:hypothetical protein